MIAASAAKNFGSHLRGRKYLSPTNLYTRYVAPVRSNPDTAHTFGRQLQPHISSLVLIHKKPASFIKDPVLVLKLFL